MPLLLGDVESLRQKMFNVKMRGQSKASPISDGFVTENHVITTIDGGHMALRIYIPEEPDRDDASFPVML